MLYFLDESALGFALFKVNEWDKIASNSAKLLKDFDSYDAFKKMVSFEASSLFQGHNVAFDTLNALREGELPAELADFLRAHLPSAKKTNFQLVVQDKGLATKINETLKVKCVSGEAYLDIFRSIRKHLAKFLSGEAGGLTRGRVGHSHRRRRTGYRPLARPPQHQIRRETAGQGDHQLVFAVGHHGKEPEHLRHAPQGELRLALPRAGQTGHRQRDLRASRRLHRSEFTRTRRT